MIWVYLNCSFLICRGTEIVLVKVGGKGCHNFFVNRLLEVHYLQIEMQRRGNKNTQIMNHKTTRFNQKIRSCTHTVDYFFRWQPWPFSKLWLLSSIAQKIDFLLLSIEFKKEPAFIYRFLIDKLIADGMITSCSRQTHMGGWGCPLVHAQGKGTHMAI